MLFDFVLSNLTDCQLRCIIDELLRLSIDGDLPHGTKADVCGNELFREDNDEDQEDEESSDDDEDDSDDEEKEVSDNNCPLASAVKAGHLEIVK